MTAKSYFSIKYHWIHHSLALWGKPESNTTWQQSHTFHKVSLNSSLTETLRKAKVKHSMTAYSYFPYSITVFLNNLIVLRRPCAVDGTLNFKNQSTFCCVCIGVDGLFPACVWTQWVLLPVCGLGEQSLYHSYRTWIIIIIMVISIARYLINKGEHTALYKISQPDKYTHKPQKIKINKIWFLAHTKHTHTHTQTHTHQNTHTQMWRST